MQPDRHRPGRAAGSKGLRDELRRDIADGRLRPGARLASLREAAARRGMSRHAVLAAYEELLGLGLVAARHGSGFYVVGAVDPPGLRPRHAPGLDQLLDTTLLIRGLVEPTRLLKCGSGALPKAWLAPLGLHRHVRSVAAQPSANLYGYGSALGYAPLREVLQRRLEHQRIGCGADRILLTSGLTQGLELVIRGLCRPGDAVLVERPGYYNLFGLLHLSGTRVLSVPRRGDGPDVQALESLLEAGERPRVFFVQPFLHNPTGSCLGPLAAHRLLLLAEKYDFMIAEDDAYADLGDAQDARLAALDGWRRVVYLSGFTKTVSAGLRVGFVAGAEPVVEALSRVKLLTSIATSEFVERVVYRAITEGGYDRFLVGLRRRLAAAQERWRAELERAGWEAFPAPPRGLFVWARHPAWMDALALARAAAAAGLWLAPGSAFDPEHAPSPWVRFNVAYGSPALSAWLRRPH